MAYRNCVVAYHSTVKEIGEDILENGGNAFDAFVASTVAECVMGEGITSLAGPLGALLYESDSGQCHFLDAGFNTPLENEGNDNTGARVPGTPAGLEEISRKFGKFSLSEVLRPAIKLAKNGFKLNSLYSKLISFNQDKLKRDNYAISKFFRDGDPLEEGEVLTFPEVAKLLEEISNKGSRYIYRGGWAKSAVNSIQKNRGVLTLKDFENYKAEWRNPLRVNFGNCKVFSCSGSFFGGLSSLLSLKSVKKTGILSLDNHYSKSSQEIESMIRINEESEKIVESVSPEYLEDSQYVNYLISEKPKEIIGNLSKNSSLKKDGFKGNHSYQISIMDNEGNAVTGTNSIQSEPFGEGIFVEGIPLSSSGKITPFSTKPGERELSSLSMHIGIHNNSVSFVSGAFSSSLIPAEFQFLTNVLCYGFSAKKSTSLPRFGTRSFNIKNKNEDRGIWLDKSISKEVVDELKNRGFSFDREGWVDTGLGSVITVDSEGNVEGSTAPI